jgi:uncharacterized protein YqeY
MLIDQIKKANIEAMKAKDADRRAIYSIVITRYQTLATSGKAQELGDADVIQIIQRLGKELDEEKEGYVKAGRSESAAKIDAQKAAIASFLPKQLSEEEIREIIAALPDKSIPLVMKHFSANYKGQCDMGLVSKVARSLQ